MATLGRYELRDRLGRGGFATVYRAWDPRLRREVALKALSLDRAEDRDTRRRFIAEAQALAALSHPHIVTVFDVEDTADRPFFTMELIEGHTLEQLLADGRRLELPEVAAVLDPLAGAIDTLHRAGLVHRDIKAANVMLDAEGRVKLMDLGIARRLDAPRLTSDSVILLSPETAAPEQARGLDAGPSSDVYALGVLTYQMLAGRPPFLGDTAALLHAHAYEAPPPLWELRPGLPPAVYATVQEALAKEPARRPSTARAIAVAVHEAAGGQRRDPTRPVRLLPRPTPRRWTRRQVASAGAGLALAGITAVVARRLIDDGEADDLTRVETGTPTPAPATGTPSPTRTPTATATVPLSGGRGPAGLPPPNGPVSPEGLADGALGSARFAAPGGVAVDAAGNLYVADTLNHRIRAIAPDGTVRTLAGSGPVGASSGGYADGPGRTARFDLPQGVAVDGAGNVYVADTFNERIRKVTPQGEVARFAGYGELGYQDGPAAQARFAGLWALAVDAAGNVYAVEAANHRVRKITPQGDVVTLAGSGPAQDVRGGGFADGPGDRARFNQPRGIAVDASGNLYVADSGNHRIRKVTPGGAVSTLAGTGKPGSTDGPGRTAQLDDPWGVAVDRAGNVYVVEYVGNRVRKIAPDGTVSTLFGGDDPYAYSGDEGSGMSAVALDGAGTLYIAEARNNHISALKPRSP